MTPSDRCPSTELLALFSSGQLEGDAFAEVELHVGDCSDCRAAIAAGVCSPDVPRAPERYRVIERLGRGSAAEVYLAEDLRLNRKVALKYLASQNVDPLAGARLLHEARLLALVSHPHVLTVYDAEVFEGRPYVVTALAPGGSLADRLRAGPLPWPEACLRFSEAAAGLHAVHQAGVVHRDFKPANVLLDERGRAQVADFGLALIGSQAWPAQLISASSAVAGTPAYLAAEVIRGEPASPRSDQFSFTVSLYEALFGQHPFPLDSMQTWLKAQQNGCPPLPRPVPSRLAAALRRGLEPVAGNRFADLEAFGAELVKVLEAPRRRRRAALIAAGVLALGGAFWVRPPSRTFCDDGPLAPGAAQIGTNLAATAQALAKAEGPRAKDVLAVFQARAHRLTADWTFHWTAACRATYDEKTQTTAELARQHACFTSQADQLRATLEQVALRVQKSPELALDALDAVQLEACRNPDATPFAAWVSRPRDGSIRQELLRLDALRTVQDYEQGELQATRLIQQARDRGQKAVEAEVTLWQAMLGYYRGTSNAAIRAAFEQAVLLSNEVGDDRLRARALVDWALFEAVAEFRYDVSLRLLNEAAAVFRRLNPGSEDFELSFARAMVLSYQRRDDEAEAAFRRTLALPDQSPDRIQVMRGRARGLVRMGANQKAQAQYREAIAMAQERYDASHPTLTMLWSDLASACLDGGQLRQALEAQSHVEPPGAGYRKPLNVIITRANTRWITFQLDPREAHLEALKQVVDELKQVPASEITQAIAQGRVAEAQLLLGRPSEALISAEARVRLLESKLAPEHPDLARARCLVGQALEEAGRPGEARRRHQQALDALSAGHPAVHAACSWLGLGRLSSGPERAALLAKVISATAHSEARIERMYRAEAQALTGDGSGAKASLEGLEGALAQRLRDRL